MDGLRTIITFIIVFGLIVIVHEFGHYFMAKRSGILVREFSIGMGPKLFQHQSKDGTTYTIRWLPLGGYVRMAGEGEDESELRPGTPVAIEVDPAGVVQTINLSKKVQLANALPLEVTETDLEDKLFIAGYINGNEDEVKQFPVDHDAELIEEDGTEIRIAPRDVQFQSARLSRRILTNFAGPFNNFLLGTVLFIIVIFMQGGVPDYQTNQLGSVVKDSPAAAAGLKAGDRVTAIDGKKTSSWQDITSSITAGDGKTLTLTVKRGAQTQQATVTPKITEQNGQKVAQVGIGVQMKTGFGEKLIGGFTTAWQNSLQIFKALGNLITGFSLNKLGGPVMIFKLSSEAAKSGLLTVITFTAMLSMNLGIMNLLPIPALDGGKLVLNAIEGVRGKPLSPEKEGILTMISFVLLLILMVAVTWNDFQRFFIK